MKIDLKGKLAIVTGSSAGIGLATSKMLLENGATVILNGRNAEKLEKIRSALTPEHQKFARMIPADLGSVSGIQELIRQVPSCDILINNLGIYQPKPFDEITDEEWDFHWEVNVMSGVRLSRHYLKGMLQKNWGRILFISSESALQIPSEMIHYGVTKTSQIALARGIAELTVGTKVTSNSILVGPTYTEGVGDFIEKMAKQSNHTIEEAEKKFFTDIRPTSLLKRFIRPDEVANFVTYLSSEESSGTNGAALRVDGGVIKSIV